MSDVTSANKFLLVLVVWVALTTSCLVAAQYSSAGGYSYGGGGQSHMSSGGQAEEFEGPEDRPKVRLGIRLRIPAFKFELPRFSLPKITVQAKIRQPDGPRVIQLPEINFDTSSKVEPPGGGGSGSGSGKTTGGYSSSPTYQASPSYSMASYGGGGDAGRSNTFTFSTGEETSAREQPTANYGASSRYQQANNQYRPASPASILAANKMNNYYHAATMRQQQARYQQQQMSTQQQPVNTYGGYGSTTKTNVHPRYSMYNMPPGGVGEQTAYQYRVEEGASVPGANSDMGFNSPATSRRAG